MCGFSELRHSAIDNYTPIGVIVDVVVVVVVIIKEIVLVIIYKPCAPIVVDEITAIMLLLPTIVYH